MDQRNITDRRFVGIGDIDIDVADRTKLLEHIRCVPAYIGTAKKRHASGIYVTEIPINPLTGAAALDYQDAEKRGYYKLDLLNNSVYDRVTSNEMLDELLKEPVPWNRLHDRAFFSQIIHIKNHYSLFCAVGKDIDSIEKMAIFLSLIRPGKRHLAGNSWEEIEKEIWVKTSSDDYSFRKSHAIAYSHLVTIDMKLKARELNKNRMAIID